VEGFVLEFEDDKNGFVDSASNFFFYLTVWKGAKNKVFQEGFCEGIKIF